MADEKKPLPSIDFSKLPTPEAEKPVEQVGNTRKALAAGVRVAAPWLASEGGPTGFGVNAGGELIAQLLESPDLLHPRVNVPRILMEGGLGTIPGHGAWGLVSPGKAGVSALKGLAIAEAGNMGRRATEKGDFDVTQMLPRDKSELLMDAGTSALGAGIGFVGGKFTKPLEPKTAPKVPETVPTGAEAQAAEAEKRMAEYEKLPRKEKNQRLKERANAHAAEDEIAKAKQAAVDAAAQAAEEQRARDAFAQQTAGRQKRTTVTETTPVPDVNSAGGKGSIKTTYVKPKKGPGGEAQGRGSVASTPSKPLAETPPVETAPQSLPEALGTVAGDEVKVTPDVPPATPPGAPSKIEEMLQGLGDEAPKVEAPAVPERPAPIVPTPEQNKALDELLAAPPPADLPADELAERMRVTRPREAPPEAALPPEVPGEEPLTVGDSNPLRVFKNKAAASGAGYRAIVDARNAGEVVPEEGRKIAGMNARQDRIDAGLPAPTRSQKIPEGAPTTTPNTDTVAQTEAARAAAANPATRVAATTTRKNNADLRKLGNLTPADRKQAILDMISGPEGRPTLGPDFRKGQRGEIDPQLALKILLSGGGALTGAALNPDDPLTGAVVGGGLGYGASRGLESIGTPEGRKTAIKYMNKLPNIERFNFLSSPSSILANALGGPVGSGVMGTLEKLLAERLGAPKTAGNAAGALADVINPKNFYNEYLNASDRASELLRNARDTERAGSYFTSRPIDWSNPKSIAAHALELPAQWMAQGDEAVRTILEKHGFPEAVARRMTLTSEPMWKFSQWVMQSTRRMKSGEEPSLLAALLLPFKRTSLNILEQGIERTPFVGILAQQLKKPEMRDGWQQMLAQQGLGAAVWLASEQLGESVDPESAKTLRKFVSNLGGQYALLSNAGFMAGQAAYKGKTSLLDMADATFNSYTQDMPLPTTQVLTDVKNAAKDTLSTGSLVLPNAVNPGFARDRGVPGGQSIEDLLFGRNLSEKPK